VHGVTQSTKAYTSELVGSLLNIRARLEDYLKLVNNSAVNNQNANNQYRKPTLHPQERYVPKQLQPSYDLTERSYDEYTNRRFTTKVV